MAASFPTKDDFVDGEVLNAADVNQVAENVNDLNTREIAVGARIDGVDTRIDGVEDDAKKVTFNAQTGTTYTLALSDAGKLVTLSNASAITLTIPAETTVVFPTGSRVDIAQLGAGQVTVVGASGVDVDAKDGDDKLLGQFSAATLIYLGSDDWLMIGDLDS
jgi:hypothetical protein